VLAEPFLSEGGDQTERKDENVDQAMTALNDSNVTGKSVLDEPNDTEIAQMSIFMFINHLNVDLMANQQDVEDAFDGYMDKKQAEDKEYFKKIFEKHSKNKYVDFYQFQAIMEEMNIVE
jgi:hypothetical protein